MPDSTYPILLSIAGTIILLLVTALVWFVKGKFSKNDRTRDDLIQMKLDTNDELSEIKMLVQKTNMTIENFTKACHMRHTSVDVKCAQHDAILTDHSQRITNLEKKT